MVAKPEQYREVTSHSDRPNEGQFRAAAAAAKTMHDEVYGSGSSGVKSFAAMRAQESAGISSREHAGRLGLPDTSIQGLEHNIADPKRSAAAKLADVELLHNKGVDKFEAGGIKYSTREEKHGHGTMVNLFGQGSDGKQHVALRGIDDGKVPVEKRSDADIKAGKDIHHEHTADGKKAGFQGDWWSQHMAAGANSADTVGQSAPKAPPGQIGGQPQPPEPPRERGEHGRRLDHDRRRDHDRLRDHDKTLPESEARRGHFKGNVQDGQKIAQLAISLAADNARKGGLVDPETGIPNCTRLARLTYAHYGLKMANPKSGVEQGHYLENLKSHDGRHMFERVSDPQAGDYAYRPWAHKTVNGRNLGDGVMVVGRTKDGGVMGASGAVAVPFRVTQQGGYYGPATYLRPTQAFWDAYKKGERTGDGWGQW